MKAISIEFDEEAKALYLKLNLNEVSRTRALYTKKDQSILIDLDKNGKIVGVEILGVDKMDYEN
jgi:uncharacterized protein YuzE